MAEVPAPAWVPARLQYNVQLRFLTEEQLFPPGRLSPPSPRPLLLKVHQTGEEADVTVTDGEVPGRPAHVESGWEVAAFVRASAGIGALVCVPWACA
jgi:hypothetical protein